MRLSNVRGQDRVLSYLENVLSRSRVHHGLLFAGQDGVGKRTVAQGLAKRLLCSQPSGLDACGQCGNCLRFKEGTHADYLVVQRHQKADGTFDKMIKVDQIRSMQRTLSLKSFVGGVRVIFILDADTMNASTANALLKTLEEPPEDSFFILTSNATNALLPTIVSRCQLVRFSPLSADALTAIFRLAIPDSGPLDEAIIAQANGSASRFAMLNDTNVQSLYAECDKRIERLADSGNAIDVLEFAEKDASDKQKKAPHLFIDLLQQRSRDVLVHQMGTDGISPISSEDILVFLNRLDRIRSELFSTQRNARIAMEEVWFGVAHLEKAI